jgi:hypothetical protein
MDKFPLELMQVYFTRSIVIAIPEHVPNVKEKPIAPPQNSIEVTKVEGEVNNYAISMRTVMNPEKDASSPYMIDMECMAFFRVDPKLSHEEATRGVTVTGHNVVYGAIREAVGWITGRQPHGTLTLGLSILKPTEPTEPTKE